MTNINGRLFFVSNLPNETTEDDLNRFFSPQIQLLQCKLKKTVAGIKTCHGYIRINCNEEELQKYLSNRKFQTRQLQIDLIEEGTINKTGKGSGNTINIKRKKKKKNDKEIIKRERNRTDFFSINETKQTIYENNTDIIPSRCVELINENGNITNYGHAILNNMTLYDVALLIQKIQSLIRASPQTAVKLLTENKFIFYSLVHALFLFGILNIKIKPLKPEELKRVNFFKIKNRFQYLCYAESKDDLFMPLTFLESDKNQSCIQPKTNKRLFEVTENKKEGEMESYFYKRKKKQNEEDTVVSEANKQLYSNFKQGRGFYGKNKIASNIKVNNINGDVTTTNIINNNTSNNIVKEKIGYVIPSKNEVSRNIAYSNNTTNTINTNNYSKGVYSFSTSNINTNKKYKKEENKKIYNVNGMFNADSEMLSKKKNVSNPYPSNYYSNREYAADHYGSTKIYDSTNYRNNRSNEFLGNIGKETSNVVSDSFKENSEISKHSGGSRNYPSNKFGKSFYNEGGIETRNNGVYFLQKKTTSKNVDNRKYSGPYRKKINKSMMSHNKSINRASINNSPPTFYNHCYNNKNSKNITSSYRNINMSMDNVHDMGSKVLYKGKYKELYGGKFKNKVSNYTKNNTNFVHGHNYQNTKTPYATFYNIKEEMNEVIDTIEGSYDKNECDYNKLENTQYDMGNYDGTSNMNMNMNMNINKDNLTNANGTNYFKSVYGNSGNNFTTIENEYKENRFDNAPLYSHNMNGSNFNDNKNIFYNTDITSKEKNEFSNFNNIIETEEKLKKESKFNKELDSNEIKDTNKEHFTKKLINMNPMEEEIPNKKDMQMVHPNSLLNNKNISASCSMKNRENYSIVEEKKEKYNTVSRKGKIREIKAEDHVKNPVSTSMMKCGQEENENEEESHVQIGKKLMNKIKTSGNPRRCIKLIDRKHNDDMHKKNIVKIKSIEVIENSDPLIRKKKDQSLINHNLKTILNKLKITLGAIPSAPDDLVNEVINERTMLDNIIKSKYEDMLKWPNEQILRVLSIRKVLKQRGCPISDII